jgi:hypothetical protein
VTVWADEAVKAREELERSSARDPTPRA